MIKRSIPWKTAALSLVVLLGTAGVATAGAGVHGKVAMATRGFPSVVVLEPVGGAPDAQAAEPPMMQQESKTFVPGVLIARVGQPVVFMNGEDLLHNVHVYDLENDETKLNVAQPVYGMTTMHTFDTEGGYVVLCDVHPEMEAYVFASSSPYAVVAEKDGSFSIADVPPGDYRLVVWNVDEKKRRTEAVTVTAGGLEVGTH